MQENELKPKLEKLGLRQKDFARLVDVSPRTVNLWATGAQPLPGSVAGYLRLLEAAEPATRETELERLVDRGRSLVDGIYAISCRGPDVGLASWALAVFRAGKITGADGEGLCFGGTYRYDRKRASTVLSVKMTLPDGGDVEASFALEERHGLYCGVVEIARETYDLDLRFLSPLPE